MTAPETSISTPSTSTEPNSTAVQARALLHALLLAGIQKQQRPHGVPTTTGSTSTHRPSTTRTQATTCQPTAMPRSNNHQPSQASPGRQSAPSSLAHPHPQATPAQHQRQPTHLPQPQQPTLIIDASTKIIGHGNTVTFPPSNPARMEQVLASALAAVMGQKGGMHVEVRTGVNIMGSRNVVEIDPSREAGQEGVRGKRKADDGAIDGEGREVKRERVEVGVE